jgi:hypothetical protein
MRRLSVQNDNVEELSVNPLAVIPRRFAAEGYPAAQFDAGVSEIRTQPSTFNFEFSFSTLNSSLAPMLS